jgi:hypothetical protein
MNCFIRDVTALNTPEEIFYLQTRKLRVLLQWTVDPTSITSKKYVTYINLAGLLHIILYLFFITDTTKIGDETEEIEELECEYRE